MVNCKNTVLGILAKILQKDLSEINALGSNTSLTDIGLDSLYTIKLVIALEEEFGITFRDEDLSFSNYDTLEKLFAMLDRYLVESET